MEVTRPLILISNDDGIQAKGIHELIKFLRPIGDLVVMAPNAARSGSGCALTVLQPVHYKPVSIEPGLEVYECSGTPTDCIKLARNTVVKRVPDLVVGGINHGDNSSTNVHYSGTMGVVIEGCLSGIPSVAFSLCSHHPDADFSATETYIQQITRMVLKNGLPPLTCLNVNFPDIPIYKGVRVCTQAEGHWEREWENCPRNFDPNYYWLTGKFVDHYPDDERNDHNALSQGYVAITPVTVDATAYSFIDKLKSWLA